MPETISQLRLAPLLKKKTLAAPLSQLEDAVAVSIDEFGIGNVKASNPVDLSYALGFLHGRERAFQMDLLRNLSQGNLRAWLRLGKEKEKILIRDQFMQVIDFSGRAKRILKRVSIDELKWLEAYARGVNKAQSTYPSFEHWAMELSWKPWTPQNSLEVLMLQSWSVTHNWPQELLRTLAITFQELDFVQQNFPGHFPNLASILKAPKDQPSLNQINFDPKMAKALRRGEKVSRHRFDSFKLKSLSDILSIKHGGSNAYLLRSDERAFLCNDTHLAHLLPSLFYLQRIHYQPQKNQSVSKSFVHLGTTIPGIPFNFSGTNGKVAYGLTASNIDTTNLVVHTGHPTSSKRNLKNVNLTSISELEGQPLINDLFAGLLNKAERKGYYSSIPQVTFDWPTDEMSPNTLLNLWKSMQASDVDELRTALQKIDFPGQNYLVVDANHRGQWFNMGIAFKGKHHGTFPQFWNEARPLNKVLPENRPYLEIEKFQATANNIVNHPLHEHSQRKEFKSYLNHYEGAPDFRFKRINELLRVNSQMDFQQFQKIQLDLKLLRAEKLTPYLLRWLKLVPESDFKSQIVKVLESWDFVARSNGQGSTVFNAIYFTVAKNLLLHHFNKGFALGFFQHSYNTSFIDHWIENPQLSIWQDQKGNQEGNKDFAVNIWKRSIDEIKESFKTFSKNSKSIEIPVWSEIHQLKPEHPLGKSWVFSFLNLEPSSPGGGYDSVWKNRFKFDLDKPLEYNISGGPVYRFCFDSSAPNQAHFSVDFGNSGRPESAFYSSEYKNWQKGKLRTMPVYSYDSLKMNFQIEISVNHPIK